MLSEIYLLQRALEQAALTIPRQHPRTKLPGKTSGPCLRIRLNEKGQVGDVESVTEDEWPGLWTIREGNQNSFPVVNLQNIFSDSQTASEKNIDHLKTLEEKKATELTQELRDNHPVHEMAARFKKALANPGNLLSSICVGVRKLNLDEKLDGKVRLAFDLDYNYQNVRTIYTREIREHLIEHLPVEARFGQRSSIIHPAPACALTGKNEPLQLEPFPKVMLPVLNKEFALFSMFSEAPCNTRYGLTDRFTVPVAKEPVSRMHAALHWIVEEDREGKTWRPVANGRFEKKREQRDLLIVYVDGKPHIDATVANLFGKDEREEQKQFEVDAQAVCKALDGIEKVLPGSKLNLFLLRKASEGQVQVVVAESFSIPEILTGATRWQQAAKNIPKLMVPLPGKKGEKGIQGVPRTPYPDQIVRLLSEQWVTNGTRSNKAQGISLGEVLDLMMRKPGKWEAITYRLMDLTLQRTDPLLLGIFGALHTGEPERWQGYNNSSRKKALQAVSVLGMLLHAFNRRKETYMNETAFRIGQLLSRADTLHREYCIHVRNGSIPPQLIGNGLMPAAADNPEDAVDRLRERMNIYIAWAKKGRGEEYGLAKWAIGQMGEISNQLPRPLRTETDRTFRAELFLGYLARSPKQTAKEDETGVNNLETKENNDVK